MWKNRFCPKAFPPLPHKPCGFSIYFSTACGKLCGKKKFYTACFVKVCGIHQKSPKTAIIPPFSTPRALWKVWINSPQPCGKAENPIFLHKHSWISLWDTPQKLRLISPQRRICHSRKGKFRYFNRNFTRILGFPQNFNRYLHAYPQKKADTQF